MCDYCRINIGGWHVTSYLQRLLQLRYPALHSLMSVSRAQEIVNNHCYMSSDYQTDLREGGLRSRVVQFPYFGGPVVGIDTAEQTEREQQKRERARQHLLRLNQRKREEKVHNVLLILRLSCLKLLNYFFSCEVALSIFYPLMTLIHKYTILRVACLVSSWIIRLV